jgi:hypothetical protein
MPALSPSRALRALVAVICSFPVVQACGGRSDTEDYLFGADGSITVGASSGGGAGGTRAGVGGSGAVAGLGNSAGVGATVAMGGNIGQAGEPAVAGTVSVAGTGQGGFGTAGTGSAGAPSGSPITCGADVCDSDTQSCCAGLAGLNCIAKGQACGGAVLGCTTNADCGGDICCISFTGDVSAASSCKARCDNMGSGRDRQLCEVDADCRMPFRFCTPTIFGVNICTRRP